MAEEIVSANNHDVVVDLEFAQDEIQIADSAKLACIVGAAIINHSNAEFEVGRIICVGPRLEMAGKLLVGNHVSVVDLRNSSKIVEHVLDHWFAGHCKQRLWLVQCKRIQT